MSQSQSIHQKSHRDVSETEHVIPIWEADVLTEIMAMHYHTLRNYYFSHHITISSMPGVSRTEKHLFNCLNVCQQVVYITRNPKDMCVSYYHYCTLVHNMKGSFEDFCELFLKGRGKTSF
jgi:hypothetical protein